MVAHIQNKHFKTKAAVLAGFALFKTERNCSKYLRTSIWWVCHFLDIRMKKIHIFSIFLTPNHSIWNCPTDAILFYSLCVYDYNSTITIIAIIQLYSFIELHDRRETDVKPSISNRVTHVRVVCVINDNQTKPNR